MCMCGRRSIQKRRTTDWTKKNYVIIHSIFPFFVITESVCTEHSIKQISRCTRCWPRCLPSLSLNTGVRYIYLLLALTSNWIETQCCVCFFTFPVYYVVSYRDHHSVWRCSRAISPFSSFFICVSLIQVAVLVARCLFKNFLDSLLGLLLLG